MSVNGVAKTHDVYDGQLRLSMMPYATMETKIVHTRMRQFEGSDNLSEEAAAYAMIMGVWDGCELLVDEGDLLPEAGGVWYFWNNRTGDYIKDYKLFIKALGIHAVDVLYEAYDSARTKIPKASPELHKGMPLVEDNPLPSSVGGKCGKKKSSR